MTDLRTPPLRGCFCCGPSNQLLSNPGRRGFMLGAGALAISAAMGRDGAGAQPADTKPFRIDVHHHLSPPTYVTASNDSGFGDPLMKNWTIEKSLDDMDRAGSYRDAVRHDARRQFHQGRCGAKALPRVE